MPNESNQDETTIDAADYRSVLGQFPTGVTVVTSLSDDGPKGVAIGSFASISIDPPLVGFFLGTQSSSGEAIKEAGAFCVNVLAFNQKELCGTMASRSDDKFDGVDWTAAAGSGSPVLPGTNAVIDCKLDQIVELGDHNLIVGRVLHLETTGESDPMVFFKGQYGTFG